MGRFDDDLWVKVDEFGTISDEEDLTKEQRDVIQAWIRAAEIYNKTGDRTLAERVGLFPKQQHKCTK